MIKLKHKLQETLQLATMAGVPLLLTGEAGTGKSESVVMVAKELGYTLHSLSVGEQTTKTDILGFIDATGTYRSTGFRKAFEQGGIFLLDEIDAGNPNVLLAINSGISNGFIEFPDAIVHSHETFKLIATANTFGTGAGIKYVGRNKLDLATLNRFAVLHWTLDEKLETELCTNNQWLRVIHEVRKLATDVDELMIGMRNTLQGVKLLDIGLPIETVFSMVITKGLDEDIASILTPAIGKYTQDTLKIGTQVVITQPDNRLLGKTGYISEVTDDDRYEVRVGATYEVLPESGLFVIGKSETPNTTTTDREIKIGDKVISYRGAEGIVNTETSIILTEPLSEFPIGYQYSVTKQNLNRLSKFQVGDKVFYDNDVVEIVTVLDGFKYDIKRGFSVKILLEVDEDELELV